MNPQTMIGPGRFVHEQRVQGDGNHIIAHSRYEYHHPGSPELQRYLQGLRAQSDSSLPHSLHSHSFHELPSFGAHHPLGLGERPDSDSLLHHNLGPHGVPTLRLSHSHPGTDPHFQFKAENAEKQLEEIAESEEVHKDIASIIKVLVNDKELMKIWHALVDHDDTKKVFKFLSKPDIQAQMPLAKLVADWAVNPTFESTIHLLDNPQFDKAIRYALKHPATSATLSYLQTPAAMKLFPGLKVPAVQKGLWIGQSSLLRGFWMSSWKVVKRIITNEIEKAHDTLHPSSKKLRRTRWDATGLIAGQIQAQMN
jgi:hypothetical protein